MTGSNPVVEGAASGPGREWLTHVPLVVNAHVRAGSVLDTVSYPQEGRAVVTIEGSNSAMVNVFAHRAELARLIGVLSAALAELDAGIVAA